MMTDPIADMLTRIRNSYASRHDSVLIPFSKLKLKIALILEKEKYAAKIREVENHGKKCIEIKLRYKDKGQPGIESIQRVSKPGLRVYKKKDNIQPVLRGYGIAIISTPEGIMTNKEAKSRGLGGEIIFEVY